MASGMTRAPAPIRIRPAKAHDWPAIWEMLEPIFRAGETYAIDRDITEADARAYWCAPHHEVFVALDAGTGPDRPSADAAPAGAADRVIGTGFVCPNHQGGGAHVANAAFATGPAAQGRGVARAMLTHALDTARMQGFRAMQFNFVVATNARAVATWEMAGFGIAGRLPGAFHHPRHGYVDALVMYRTL